MQPERRKFKTEQLAWGIMLLSFALFCVICVASSVGLYLFLFESTMPVNARLEVARGTVILTDADFNQSGARQTTAISRMTSISTDDQSQASLVIESVHGDDIDLIASITVENGSVARLQNVTAPRFSWSTVGHHIDLRDLNGNFDILVMPSEDFTMALHTAQGAVIDITSAGRYTLVADSNRVRLTTRTGSAVISTDDARSNNRLVSDNEQGLVFSSQSRPSVGPARENLIENGLFMFDIPDEIEGSATTALPGRWGCSDVQDELPRGAYYPDTLRGRPGLRLIRGDAADSNGQTRCVQQFGSNGVDVSENTFLELETTFLLNYQSLSKCGTDGSECPLMLRIDYLDVTGAERVWVQGFYYADDPAYDYPSRCLSCVLGEHRRVNEKTWYTYKTGNLMRLLAQHGAPAIIQSVEFYGSGHQYDVMMGEIGLYTGLADVADISSPTEESAEGSEP